MRGQFPPPTHSFLLCSTDVRRVHVIVVAWLLRVYGICTLSVVLCTPEGEARGSTYNYTKGTYPYTRESHVTANLYYDMIEFTISTSKN